MSTPRSTSPVFLVGAGPAGVSAALWLTDFGVPFDWVDAAGEVGGLLRRVHNQIDNYPGGTYEDGMALCEAMQEHLNERELSPRQASVTGIEIDGDEVVAIEDGSIRHTPRRLLLATGTSYRRLGVPGEDDGLGRWISQSATADGSRFAGRPVAVVGGGDAGFENALRLAEFDCPVTLLLRGPDFRARSSFIEAVHEHPAITIAPIPSTVQRIEETSEGCRLIVDRRGETIDLNVAALFVRIGVDPRLPPGCETLETDDGGFLVVDDRLHSSHRRILGLGDITSTPLRAVARAVSDGAVAARICAAELELL